MKTKDKGWQDFKFTNPQSKKIEDKTAYIEKVGNIIVMSCGYKKYTFKRGRTGCPAPD